MERDSRSKATKRGQLDGQRPQDLWHRGIDRLIDQGKLMWLLGEGLNAAMAAQTRGWSPTDEQGFVSACYQWVQQSISGPSLGSVDADQRAVAGGAAHGHKEPAARPTLDLQKVSLSNQACPVLWIGSRAVSNIWKSMVLGVGLDGFRRVLALLDGSVREGSVADRLLDDLESRGFTNTCGVLVITEGSRTLDNSLQRKWGPTARVSHCRTRVSQDVTAHVPEARRDAVLSELEDAWSMPVDAAVELLRDLESRLRDEAPGASERLSRSVNASLILSRLELSSPLKERLLTAGSLGMAFKKCLKFAPPDSGAEGFALGVGPWLSRSRRLVGWRGLELLAHKLAAAPRMPANKAAPNTLQATGAAERIGSEDDFAE